MLNEELVAHRRQPRQAGAAIVGETSITEVVGIITVEVLEEG